MFETASMTRWRSTASIGDSWCAVVDDSGTVQRLRDDGTFEAISGRYGLEAIPVNGIAAVSGQIAFSIEGGMAIADGVHVTHFDLGFLPPLVGLQQRLAALVTDGVGVFDVALGQQAHYPLSGAEEVAFDGSGVLWARASNTLYKEANGTLTGVYNKTLRGPVVSGKRAWVALDGELGSLEDGALYATHGLALATDGRLIGGSKDDVWVQSAAGLQHFVVNEAGTESVRDWQASIQPVFVRSCSKCHQPGGSASVSLATYEDWTKRSTLIHTRVVDDASMPPAGNAISAEDKAAVQAWTEAHPSPAEP